MADTEKWLTYVSPIVGPCDKIIFAFGADITGVDDYTGQPKFDYLKSKDSIIIVMLTPVSTGFSYETIIFVWVAATWTVIACIIIQSCYPIYLMIQRRV